MRIRWRLALYGATVTFVSVFGFALLLVALGSATSVTDHEEALQVAVATALEDFSTVNPAQLESFVTPFTVDSPTSLDVFFVAVGKSGLLQFSTGLVANADPTVPAAVILEALSTGESIAVAPVNNVEMRMVGVPWPASWPDEGVLVAMQPTEFAADQLSGLQTVLSIAGMISVLSTTIVVWLVSGRALRPLTVLAETTDKIAKTGNLAQKLPKVRPNDEVSRLSTSFNAMLSSLDSTRAQLADSLAAQKRFVGDASHELRSPLTTIRNNAGFLMDRPDASPDDRAEAIVDISKEADRMTLLVDDLLLLARGDELTALAKRPVHLGDIARAIAQRAEKAGVAIDLQVIDEITVFGDEVMLDRLLWILVDNAAKHGQPPLQLTVAQVQETAIVTMADAGEGFPVDNPDQVFARFFQADQARTLGGSGLGLSIADGITKAHSGSIAASNPPNGGGLITVRLPLG